MYTGTCIATKLHYIQYPASVIIRSGLILLRLPL